MQRPVASLCWSWGFSFNPCLVKCKLSTFHVLSSARSLPPFQSKTDPPSDFLWFFFYLCFYFPIFSWTRWYSPFSPILYICTWMLTDPSAEFVLFSQSSANSQWLELWEGNSLCASVCFTQGLANFSCQKSNSLGFCTPDTYSFATSVLCPGSVSSGAWLCSSNVLLTSVVCYGCGSLAVILKQNRQKRDVLSFSTGSLAPNFYFLLQMKRYYLYKNI